MSVSTQAGATKASESFASLFEKTISQIDQLNEGDIVQGTIVRVSKDQVVVDIGYKSEGVIPISEFAEPGETPTVVPGETVDVLIESKETDDGLILLSKEKADRLRVWDEISEACERNELIEGTITSRVKGGLSVTIRGGVKAFLPGSQVDLRPVRNLDKLMGQTFRYKVIKFNKKRGNIVLSRRALLEEQRDELKQQTLEGLQEGQIVTGAIKNLTEYGAFVDLGGIDGLLHVTDMSWGRVGHPSEVFSVGDQVTVMVLKYNSETERVSLGLKQTTEDPWNTAQAHFPVGTKVQGKVVSITDYGVFVEMERGVEGLIHVSEMAWKKPKHPSKLVEVGQEVECVVLEVDIQNKRISLGMKQLAPDPWTEFSRLYKPGDIVRGVVRSITDYGVFVGVLDGVDGMVHRSDLTWSDHITNPADLYQKGDEVEAIILSISHEDQRVSLGIKQLYEDPWTFIPERYSLGTVLEVRVMSHGDSGTIVELERGVEGSVPFGALGPRGEELRKSGKVGEILKAEVVAVDEGERNLQLSFLNVEDRALSDIPDTPIATQRAAVVKPRPSTHGATLGDLFKGKFDNLSVPPSEDEDDA